MVERDLEDIKDAMKERMGGNEESSEGVGRASGWVVAVRVRMSER